MAMTYRIAMLAAVAAKPVNTVQAGELVIDPPTLINPGFALGYGKPAPHYGLRT
jgi:hypothetical protein